MRAVEKRLRERNKALEKELEEVKQDRQKFRDDHVNNLRTAIKIHGEGKLWNMSNLIETIARQLHAKQKFYW